MKLIRGSSARSPDRNGDPGPEAVSRGLQRGEAAAVRLVRERVRRILAYRGFGIPREERRDLEQEVMTQLWQAANRPGFAGGERFWGFVEVVASRRCIDWLRKRRETEELADSLPDDGEDPAAGALARERRTLALEVLSRLDRPCRDLIYLRVGLEKSYREISRLLGRSEGALRVQLHRCIGKAQRAVDEQEAPGGDGADGES